MDTNVSLLFILLAAEGLCPKVRVCLALYNERLSIPQHYLSVPHFVCRRDRSGWVKVDQFQEL
jgi:hypothetical protein